MDYRRVLRPSFSWSSSIRVSHIVSLIHLVKLGGDCCFQQSTMILLAIKDVKAIASQALPLMGRDSSITPKMARRGLGETIFLKTQWGQEGSTLGYNSLTLVYVQIKSDNNRFFNTNKVSLGYNITRLLVNNIDVAKLWSLFFFF